MRYIERKLAPVLLQSAKRFPSVVLTGPRRAGKTTVLRHLFPRAQYVLLEDPDIRGRIQSDPRSFLEELRPPVIFDEIQNAPDLLNYVRTIIDSHPQRMGQWLFTGSQEAPLMRGITESMAGRAAILQLLPLSLSESKKVNLLHGGFPEALAHPNSRDLWFASYLQTYLERDVRAITNVRDLVTFRRFLAIVASRHGQILNKTDIAAPLGVSVTVIANWLSILESTGEIILLPPYFENFGKRLVKSPKVYWTDSGLACHLLGIRSAGELERSPFLGPLFEGFVASELLKIQLNQGLRRELYYFRDHQGLEVDFLLPASNGALWLVEAKASKTVHPQMASALSSLQKNTGNKPTRLFVVHRKSNSPHTTSAIAKGVEALDVDQFISLLTATLK